MPDIARILGEEAAAAAALEAAGDDPAANAEALSRFELPPELVVYSGDEGDRKALLQFRQRQQVRALGVVLRHRRKGDLPQETSEAGRRCCSPASSKRMWPPTHNPSQVPQTLPPLHTFVYHQPQEERKRLDKSRGTWLTAQRQRRKEKDAERRAAAEAEKAKQREKEVRLLGFKAQQFQNLGLRRKGRGTVEGLSAQERGAPAHDRRFVGPSTGGAPIQGLAGACPPPAVRVCTHPTQYLPLPNSRLPRRMCCCSRTC